MCSCGNSTLWKCGDVVDPHCQDVEMSVELSSLDYYTHHISQKTIPPKMTKLFSKLNLTKLFYILPQQDQDTIIDQLVDTSRKLSQS